MNERPKNCLKQSNTIISKKTIDHKHTVLNVLDQNIRYNPKTEFEKLNKNDLKVIDIICLLCVKHKTTYVSQSTIASWTNLTRRQINRIIGKVCKLGIIRKIFREYNTSIYFLHDFFRDLKIKRILKKFIPNIDLLAFSCKNLLSIAREPINKKNNNISKVLHYYSPFFYDHDRLMGGDRDRVFQDRNKSKSNACDPGIEKVILMRLQLAMGCKQSVVNWRDVQNSYIKQQENVSF